MSIYPRFAGRLVVAGLVLLSSVSSALAAPVVTFNFDVRTVASQAFPNTTAARNSFLSQVSALGVTSYDQNLDLGSASITNPSFGFPGSTITATTTNFTYETTGGNDVNDANNGRADLVNGVNVLRFALIESEVASGVATVPLHNWITFSQPINAFGVYVLQAGDTFQHPVTFVLENTTTGATENVVENVGPQWGGFSIAYLGIIDTTFAFNQVTMTEDTDVGGVDSKGNITGPDGISDDIQDGIIWDNLTIAALPVPEPSSLLLLATGFAIPFLALRGSRAKTLN